MTTLRQMQIRGIRSFGAGENEEQTIQFRSPLTIIIGENGCGKTTIIECLKYGLTGEFPPNTGTGGHFLRELSLDGKNTVQAQVKLQIEDSKGNRVTVSRLSKKEKLKGTEKFSSLQPSVAYSRDKDEPQPKKTSTTKRIADVTTEMCEVMGVSKPIINNVIFCHQEESTWPFAGDKELKVKFDAIFGTTEYIKVVEDLVKERKARQESLKQLASEERLLAEAKDEVQRKRNTLSRYELELGGLQTKLAVLKNDLKPIEEELATIINTEAKYSQMYKKRVELETAIQQLEERQSASRNKIINTFTGDIFELEQEIRNFEASSEKANETRATCERDLRSMNTQKSEIEARIKQYELQTQKVKNEIEQQQETSAKQAQLVQTLGKQLKLSAARLTGLDNDEALVTTLISEMDGLITQEVEKTAQMSRDMEKMDQKFQSEVDKLREEKTKTDTEMQGKKSSRIALSKERGELTRQINFIENSQVQMIDILEEIARVDRALANSNQTLKIDQKREQLQDEKVQRDKLQVEADKLDEQITECSAEEQTLNEIAFKETELQKNESNYKILLNKNTQNLTRLFGRTLESNFKAEIDRKIRTLDTEVKEANLAVTRHSSSLVELRTIRKNQRDRLSTMEGELKKAEDEVYEKCGGDDFEELFEKTKERYMKAQLDYGAVKSSEALFKKYISQVKDQTCCPLCHKDMNTIEREMLSDELNDEISQLPDKIASHERKLKAEERSYNQLMALKSVNSQIGKLKADIPALKEDSKKKDDEIKKLQSELEDLEMSLGVPSTNHKLASNMVSDMGQLDILRSSIDKQKQEVAVLKGKISNADRPVSLADLKTSRQEKQQQLRDLRTSIDKLEKDLDKSVAALAKIQESRTQLIEQKVKMQENAASLPEKKARLTQLQQEVDAIDDRINELQANLSIIARQLEEKVNEKAASKEKNRLILQKAQAELAKILDMQKEIRRNATKLQEYAAKQLTTQMEQLQAQFVQKRRELQQSQKKIDELTVKLDEAKSEIANQESAKRDLVENLDLKRVEEDLQTKKREMGRLSTDACNLDYERLRTKKTDLMKTRDKKQAERDQTSGHFHRLELQIKEVRDDLALPKNMNAFEIWMKKMHMRACVEMIVDDLESFRTALESSLTEFHKEKMQQINQSIRSLWREIYRGNDIDYIEIRANEPKEVGVTRVRRYSYCVMQGKNGIEMEMRGRCSAGQKILASLIIRMALSETFSANCGVMTLDEPTTNLDQENIASLCEALSKILEDRGRYGNLMLIIITHDEKFLQTLAPYLAAAYRVSRDRDGKSIITKAK